MSDRSQVTVELDVFSGRPNPTWSLEQPERDVLLQLLRARNAEARARWEPPGLGYRGFVLHIASDGKVEVVRVGGGTIEAGATVRIDRDRAVEAHLLRTMPAELRTQFLSLLPQIPT